MRARVGRYRRGVVVVALGLVVGACTAEPEPLPPPPESEDAAAVPEIAAGVRVGVVLPSEGVQEPVVQDALREQLGALVGDPDAAVLQLQTHPVPEQADAADVVGWLAEQRLELVCVIGRQAEPAVAVAAALYRGVRFCALPVGDPPEIPAPTTVPDGDDPGEDGDGGAGGDTGDGAGADGRAPAADDLSDGILRIGLRAAELGELVGIAAREQAGDEPVGLVLGGGLLPPDAFRSGLLTGLAGADVIEAGGAGRDVALEDRARAVLAAGAGVVILDEAEGARAALSEVGDQAAVFGPDDLDASRRPPLALGWTVRWDRAVSWPLQHLLDEPGDGDHVSLGLRDGVFELVTGPGAADGVADALAVARARIIAATAPESSAAPVTGWSSAAPVTGDLR